MPEHLLFDLPITTDFGIDRVMDQMMNQKPTSPEYQSIQLLEMKKTKTIYEYHYRPDSLHWLGFFLPKNFLLPLLHFTNEAIFYKETNQVYFKLTNIGEKKVYDIFIHIRFLGYQCSMELLEFNIFHSFSVPEFVKTRIIQHLFRQIRDDLLALFL